ncbi:MAG: hypothetical protein FWE45_00595 [Firmicutes bacterium]|nr:hypothetical protein [Bacillota bacterium]
MDYKEEFKQMLDEWGEDAQIEVCIEEMAELTQALIKYKRMKRKPEYHVGREQEYLEHIKEEVADVLNCVHQMAHIFGEEEICKICDEKIKRTINRLKDKK